MRENKFPAELRSSISIKKIKSYGNIFHKHTLDTVK